MRARRAVPFVEICVVVSVAGIAVGDGRVPDAIPPSALGSFAPVSRPPAPPVVDYRLGNRSALEWVIDQYRVKTDKRSGITSDPNNADDPEYIVRLVGQVVRVSVETVRIVNRLAELPFREE